MSTINPDDEGYSAFDSWKLQRFEDGKLSEDQIYMMLINAIKRLETRLDWTIRKLNKLEKGV